VQLAQWARRRVEAHELARVDREDLAGEPGQARWHLTAGAGLADDEAAVFRVEAHGAAARKLPATLRAEPGCSLLRRIYVQETLRFFEVQLASTGVLQPRGGAVNFAHRIDGALRINPHFHTLVLDGAYDNATRPQFHELSQLSLSDLESILSRIIARFVRALRRRGLLPASGDSNQDIEIPEELAQLAASVSAAVQQGSALGQGSEWITELADR
jgi:hypothetical protein